MAPFLVRFARSIHGLPMAGTTTVDAWELIAACSVAVASSFWNPQHDATTLSGCLHPQIGGGSHGAAPPVVVVQQGRSPGVCVSSDFSGTVPESQLLSRLCTRQSGASEVAVQVNSPPIPARCACATNSSSRALLFQNVSSPVVGPVAVVWLP